MLTEWVGWVKRICIPPREFRYERPWLKDERRSYICHKNTKSVATHKTLICKAWCEDSKGRSISGYFPKLVARPEEGKLPLPKKGGQKKWLISWYLIRLAICLLVTTQSAQAVLGEIGIKDRDVFLKKMIKDNPLNRLQLLKGDAEMLYCSDIDQSDVEGYVINVVSRVDLVSRESMMTRKFRGIL